MSDDGNGIRYTTKEAIEALRAEMTARFDKQDDTLEQLGADVSQLKEFRASIKDSLKLIAFIITTAVAISMGLLYSGVLH